MTNSEQEIQYITVSNRLLLTNSAITFAISNLTDEDAAIHGPFDRLASIKGACPISNLHGFCSPIRATSLTVFQPPLEKKAPQLVDLVKRHPFCFISSFFCAATRNWGQYIEDLRHRVISFVRLRIPYLKPMSLI
ncbi:hypothetical protein FALCPG4_015711 [Fusarium falciforme]